MKMTGAEIVVNTLIEQGVTDVFGYPGGQVLNIYDALYNNSDRINHILTAHEQGASHAADGYSRATGKVGVVISQKRTMTVALVFSYNASANFSAKVVLPEWGEPQTVMIFSFSATLIPPLRSVP